MKRLNARRVVGCGLLVALVVSGFLAAAVVSGKAPAATARPASTAGGAIHLRINLERFQYVRRQHRLVARGQAVATYRSGGSVHGTAVKAVALSVQQGTTCNVLHLELGELRLNLLGLIVTLTPVGDPSIVLDISADSSGALGKLLCQVISSIQSGSLAKTTKATRGLSALVRKQYSGGVVNADVPLASQQARQTTTSTAATTGTTVGTTTTGTTTTPAAGQCQVLDLVLGPLNLDLLGLVVSLNKVQLDISANPTGALGTLFCQLAGSSLPLTTALTGLTTGLTGTSSTAPTGVTTTTPPPATTTAVSTTT